MALTIIQQIGTGGGQGCVIEYRGQAVRDMSIEQRMTLCNMTVEAGASAGIISPDLTTVTYLQQALEKRGRTVLESEVKQWLLYASDKNGVFDEYISVPADKVKKMISWGTNPSQVLSLDDCIPHPDELTGQAQKLAAKEALEYMDLVPG